MGKLLTFVLWVFAGNSAFAGHHELTSIAGRGIVLQLGDHAIAGSVKDRLVFGYQLNDEFGSKLIIRKERESIESVFRNVDGVYQGTIRSADANGAEKLTTIEFVKIDKHVQSIILKINGEVTPVRIEADDFVNQHFINPEYSLYHNGEEISFKIEAGQACYGLSLNLIYMVVGAYLH